MANNIERYNQIKEEAHSNIESGYTQAIANYQVQKQAFMKQLNIEEEQAMKQVLEEINKEIYKDSDIQLNEKMDDIFNKISSYLEEFVINALEGHPDDLANIKLKLNNIRSDKNASSQLRYISTIIKADIENLLAKDNITRLSLIKYIQSSGINLGGEKNKSLQDNLFGYLRRLIIQRYTSDTIIKGMTINLTAYKNSLKGYLQEEAIEMALQKVLSRYGYTARQTGAIESDVGQEIIYDLVLGPQQISGFSNKGLRQLIKKMDSTQNITEEGFSSLPENVFLGGIQSKSWTNPTVKKPQFISFGIHSSLIPTGDKKYYWHGGVSSLMSRMSDVIGRNNFLFATGSELSFTADLLSQLRERSYVLNFHKNKKEAISNPQVYADIHADKD